MDAKEKANELFNKYFFEIRMPSDCEGCMQCVDRCGNMGAIAKKYSLIAVEEIINSRPAITDSQVDYNNFWTDVKSELQSF